jgi:molybdopterin-guanine dinucleotide biosynthesis protein A
MNLAPDANGMNDVPGAPAPVYGLLLAGGRSSRMGRDKATLPYAGRTQLERAMDLLGPRVRRHFVSLRADQAQDPARRAFPHILDRQENLGPLAGILAAQAEYPHVAWLVLACDLPLLDGPSLDELLARRAPARLATAYRSSHDRLPEPLCAIWEPASREPLIRYAASGRDCPRKFLIGSDVELLDQPHPRALDNINTPAEYRSVMNQLDPAVRSVSVQYFAILREQAGRSEERLSTTARTPRELYAELRGRHPFTLEPAVLRVAVNAEFCDWEQPLAAGDTVVFIPPVAGG